MRFTATLPALKGPARHTSSHPVRRRRRIRRRVVRRRIVRRNTNT